MGSVVVDRGDIVSRRLATPQEWDKINVRKSTVFDWSAWQKARDLEKEQAAIRAAHRRADQEIRARERARLTTRMEERRKIGTLGSQTVNR